MASLSLTLVEIIVLMLGAIILGITIHFFIVSRRSLSTAVTDASAKTNKELEDWKLRYFNDIEFRDKELNLLKKKLSETEENNDINTIEADEMRILNKKLKAELELLRNTAPTITPSTENAGDYIEQLKLAQRGLLEHNEKINILLSQIDIVKESEAKQQELQRVNEELSNQINDLKYQLSQNEKEINNTRQKAHLTSEMTSMLDSAYNEFNTLQAKILKLEGQVNNSRRVSMDFEDLQEGYHKLLKDFDQQKLRYNAAVVESQQFQASFEEVQDKLKEANFQRQQLQKRVAYLEELNNDMQSVADANKKLEGQLKRVGELESMLNVISEERDELVRKQTRTY